MVYTATSITGVVAVMHAAESKIALQLKALVRLCSPEPLCRLPQLGNEALQGRKMLLNLQSCACKERSRFSHLIHVKL